MQERRKLTRWRINKASKIKLEGAVASADCLIRDINFKGLQIVLGLRLAVDTYIRFNLQLSENHSLQCEAWVAWHRHTDGHNVYGLLFTKITDKDKENIYKFVYNNVPQEISRHWWDKCTMTQSIQIEEIQVSRFFICLSILVQCSRHLLLLV